MTTDAKNFKIITDIGIKPINTKEIHFNYSASIHHQKTCTGITCKGQTRSNGEQVHDPLEINPKQKKITDYVYTPGVTVLVGDKEEAGMASDFTGVVVDTVVALLGPSSWACSVVLRLTLPVYNVINHKH